MRDAVIRYPVGKQFQMRRVAAYVISRCGVFMIGTTLLRTYLLFVLYIASNQPRAEDYCIEPDTLNNVSLKHVAGITLEG